MKIKDLSIEAPVCENEVIYYESVGQPPMKSQQLILHEAHLQVYLNEVLSMNIVCTPTHLPEMILGHLYSEGRITDPDIVDLIYICADAARARVFAKGPIDIPAAPLEIRSCNCGESGQLDRYDADLRVLPDFHFDSTIVPEIARTFFDESPLFHETRSAHSAILAHKGKILYFYEDIGRHNALDKVIGAALLEGIPLEECVVFTSGRVPADMMEKVIRSRIPVLLSKSVPTDAAVELARAYHVHLLCSVRERGWSVFSSPKLWHNLGGKETDNGRSFA